MTDSAGTIGQQEDSTTSVSDRRVLLFMTITGKEKPLELWITQILTMLGVILGAITSFIATRLLDRGRWQREEALRWDTRRLECYSEFAASIKRHITITRRLCANLGLPTTDQPLDTTTGLAALATVGEDLTVKWEQVLMLGSPDAITAARYWRHAAWRLEWFARGLRDDATEFRQANEEIGVDRKRFYAAVRADLGIVSSELPETDLPPAWRPPPDTSATGIAKGP